MCLHNFIEEEDGAATVDWVVLAAACVALAVGVSEVTANAMASLSNDVRAELTNTDPSRNYFDEIMNLAIFAEYDVFYDGYGEEWGDDGLDQYGNSWAEAAYNAYSSMDDQALSDYYTATYEAATEPYGDTGQPDPSSVDHVAVIERIMTDRNLDMPADNLNADEIRALNENWGT